MRCSSPKTAASTSTTASTSGASPAQPSRTSARAASSRAAARSPSNSCAAAFLDRSRTYSRKVREAWLATELETRFGKNEILQAYLNRVYFGDGYYGVEAASRGYFGKPASELNATEGATLAALINRPSGYGFAARRPGSASAATGCCAQMLQEGLLDTERLCEQRSWCRSPRRLPSSATRMAQDPAKVEPGPVLRPDRHRNALRAVRHRKGADRRIARLHDA